MFASKNSRWQPALVRRRRTMRRRQLAGRSRTLGLVLFASCAGPASYDSVARPPRGIRGFVSKIEIASVAEYRLAHATVISLSSSALVRPAGAWLIRQHHQSLHNRAETNE